jgi:DNA-binding HxlR family transcriptional regulator/peroxiredoxin
MSRNTWTPEQNCALAHAASVVGDWWSMLIVRDVARGLRRFDELVAELGIARKVLTDRLGHLVAHGVLERRPYQHSPTRYEYHLTARGRALLPALVTLQDWGEQWLLGDGRPSATTTPRSSDAKRVRALVGTQVPVGQPLPATTGEALDPADSEADTTVVFTYPATGIPGPLPDNWSDIPGTAGCTLENRLFRDALPRFTAVGAAVRGVSTQRPDEQRAFAAAEGIPFPLLSDADLQFTAALRLPTFRAGDNVRMRRLILVVNADREIRAVRYPVTDIADGVEWALTHAKSSGRTTPPRTRTETRPITAATLDRARRG